MAVISTAYVGTILKRTGMFQDAQIAVLLEDAARSDCGMTELVVRNGLAREEDFLKGMAEVMRVDFVKLSSVEVAQDVLGRLPTKVVFQYNVMPIAFAEGVLTVAASEPLNAGLIDALRMASGVRVRLALSPANEIGKAVKRFYGVGADTVDRMMRDDKFGPELALEVGKLDLNELDPEASIVKFVNQIVLEACQMGATDIHLEPMEDRLRIRYRIDGVLHETPMPQQLNRFQAAIISRIKVMANLDIAEKRLPMDGRIGLTTQGQDIDIRVSTMPTIYGESVSLRLLRKHGGVVQLSNLGLNARDGVLIKRLIERPNGIVLVTGPTGSGKSTSLYAFLHEINTTDQRILTVEDPIEYEMPGVNQVLVRPDIGLTFARVLRSFLRQDPDIIMVGEIRDRETAEIAINASLTGHLVFSTLHTNDSSGAFTRLTDMGVEAFLVASAVVGVAAQRLVRRLCGLCKRPMAPDAAKLRRVGFPTAQLAGRQLFEAVGCEKCVSTGFHGRTGIFELLEVTESIESLVVARRPMSDIKRKAVEEGMTTLRDDGWMKVADGVTTIEEVIRVTEANEE